MWSYFLVLLCSAGHRTFILIEGFECVFMLAAHVVKDRKPEWEHGLNTMFYIFLGSMFATFFIFLFVASFNEDQKHKAIEGKLSESLVKAQSQLDEYHKPKLELLKDKVDPGNWLGHFRITVKNTSHKTVEGVGVAIRQSEPPIDHLPIPLHCSHLTRPLSDRVNLDPEESRTFDIVRYRTKPGHEGYVLDVAGCSCEENIKIQKYVLTLSFHAKDMKPFEHTFLLEPSITGMPKKDFKFELIS